MLAPDAPPFLAPEKLGHPSRSILSPFERKKVKFFVRLINNPSSRSNYGIDINFHSRMIVCMYIYIYIQSFRNCYNVGGIVILKKKERNVIFIFERI